MMNLIITHLPRLFFLLLFSYLTWPLVGEKSVLFNWHPFLMSLSFAFFLPDGLSYFNSKTSLLPFISNNNHSTKVRFHWMVMLAAAVSAVFGVAAIYYNKVLNHKPHFTSWHGLLGIWTLGVFLAQAFGGIFLLYPALSLKLVSKQFVKKCHMLSGSIVAVLGYSSLVLSTYSNWFTSRFGGLAWYLFLAPIVLWGWSIMTNILIKRFYLDKAVFVNKK